MQRWAAIAACARAQRLRAAARAGTTGDGPSLVDAALAENDIKVGHFGEGELVGPGVAGFVIHEDRMVFVGGWLPPETRALVLAHELGHFHLHPEPHLRTAAARDVGSGSASPHGYSPQELKEQQAEAFAREFLCPADDLRAAFMAGRRPSDLAASWHVPLDTVLEQAQLALLRPPGGRDAGPAPDRQPALDGVQARAVEWTGGNLVLEGGPGTGKTTALIARVRRLCDRGIPAASILAVAQSERAAEGMRAALPIAINSQAWIGTLRSFALDVVGKWPATLERRGAPRVLDRTAALAVLERGHAPADAARLLRTFSRCKANLVGPEAFVRQALHDLGRSPGKDHDRARATVDAGRAFLRYEAELAAENAMDAGDVVPAAIRILDGDPAARADCAGRFRHVLVDDHEDATPADRTLIGILSDLGADLWVAGGDRSAIHRFGGATGDAIASATGVRLTLAGNKRSSGAPLALTDLLLAPHPVRRAATPHAGARVGLTTAPDAKSEARAIADQIETLRAKGVPYRDQAVLARAHLTLDRLAGHLRDAGVPLAHFGDLQARPEVADLMAVLTLDAPAISRIAGLPDYAIAREDVTAFLGAPVTRKLGARAALSRVDASMNIGEAGLTAFRRLATDLAGITPETPPGTALRTWLFERGPYLRRLLAQGDAPDARMALLAVHHVLNICDEHEAMGGVDPGQLRARIAQAGSHGQETGFRRVFPETSELDAVRVLTIHASKGLAFRAVHLAGLSEGYHPAPLRRNDVPMPQSLEPQTPEERHRLDEEGLLLVATSRASDHLHLYRAETYATKAVRESRVISLIGSMVERRHLDPPRSTAG